MDGSKEPASTIACVKTLSSMHRLLRTITIKETQKQSKQSTWFVCLPKEGTGSHRERRRDRERQRETERETERDRERQRETERETERERQRDTDRDIDIDM